MPEGPEIHREADQIRDVIGGETCTYIYFYYDHLKKYEGILTEFKVKSVEAFGKAIVIRFEDEYLFFSHNQLYGKWMFDEAGNCPDTNRHLRVEFQTDQQSALLYSASDIEVMKPGELEEHSYIANLGPDILKGITTDEIAERTASEKFNTRSFAALMLDQHFLSGLGNYLRTEILFHSRIHPKKRPLDLSDEEIYQFAKSVLTIAQRSYHTGGITISDEFPGRSKSRKKDRFYLFAREGEECRVCGEEIIKTRMSGRRIYLCKSCQVG